MSVIGTGTGRAAIRAALFAGVVGGCLIPTARLQAVEEVKASHILVRTQEEAQAVREEILENGGDREAFSAACREHSLDVYTKRQAGDLGYFPPQGKMDPVFSQAAFALGIGEISQPVKTQHGWHLIYVRDRRDRTADGQATAEGSTSTADGHEGHDHEGHDHAGHDHATTDASATGPERSGTPDTDRLIPGETSGTATRAADVAAPQAVVGTRRTLPEKRLTLSIESVEALNFPHRANRFVPENAAELNLVLKNGGSAERRVPDPALLPLGFELAQHHDGESIEGDFSSLAKPEKFFVPLRPYEMIGLEVSVNDYFKGLQAVGRFDLSWSSDAFFRNLETRFPEVRDVAGYDAAKSDLNGRLAIQVDKVRRDGLPHWRLTRSKPYAVSILPRIKPGDELYARIQIQRETSPVYVKLDTERAYRAAQQFAQLALEGFYDMLNFYEIEAGDYIIGGDPLRQGTGAPAMSLARVRNTSAIPHEEGTVSFISRSLRSQGPIRGGEIGSIFFVSFQRHPEWDDVHVPFGKVVSGLDVLKRVTKTTTIESITVVPAYEYLEEVGGPEGAAQASGAPEVVIKTAKGDLRLNLHEDEAPNTVSNFITLAEDGFFDSAEDGGKQKFFRLMTDSRGRKVLIQTGSPTNQPVGGADYKIPDEVNDLTCQRGSLVMTKQFDPQTGTYVPDTASSQFFICLRDIRYYDELRSFTVFGQVAPEALDVLDQLEEGDEVESVEVTRKGERNYTAFQKVR